LFFLFATVALGAADASPIDPSDDFSPMCFGFVFIALCGVLVLIGLGVVAAGIAAVYSVILIALGIVSSAAFIGILRRRFSFGFHALHYQFFAVVGLPAGIGASCLASHFFAPHFRIRDIVAAGSIAGIGASLLLAFATDKLAVFAYRRLVSPSSGMRSKMPDQATWQTSDRLEGDVRRG
jgi:hypothetical protein